MISYGLTFGTLKSHVYFCRSLISAARIFGAWRIRKNVGHSPNVTQRPGWLFTDMHGTAKIRILCKQHAVFECWKRVSTNSYLPLMHFSLTQPQRRWQWIDKLFASSLCWTFQKRGENFCNVHATFLQGLNDWSSQVFLKLLWSLSFLTENRLRICH